MISVIVPHQLDSSKPYLHLCLQALQASKDTNFEVTLVDGSETHEDLSDTYPNFKHIYDRSAVGVSKKLEIFMNSISKNTSHIALVSDDVMVSQYMLADMHSAFQGRDMIMNPTSNSDCISLYESDLFLRKQTSTVTKRIYPDMQLEDIRGWEQSVIEYPRRSKCLVPFHTLSFFCTMIPISVWDKIGNLDEKMEYRHNDQDYCLRARQLGIPSVVNFGAFAFHFGSKTMRHMANDEMKSHCSNHFKSKWG